MTYQVRYEREAQKALKKMDKFSGKGYPKLDREKSCRH